MSNLAILGIDPGISEGNITILENGKLLNFKMIESFQGIKDILRPFGGDPRDTKIRCSIEQLSMRPGQSSFITSRMQPMLRNYDRVKDALIDLNIPFQEVAPTQWQKFHNLRLPKGQSEKGMDIEELKKNKEDLRHLVTHLSIERNTPNDIVWSYEIVHILETTHNKEKARSMLRDDYAHFTKYELNKAIKETENTISKYKAKEKNIRKGRYQTEANFIYLQSILASKKLSTLEISQELNIPNLSSYFNRNLFLSKEEMKKLWKYAGVKPLVRREADSLLILLYQLHNG